MAKTSTQIPHIMILYYLFIISGQLAMYRDKHTFLKLIRSYSSNRTRDQNMIGKHAKILSLRSIGLELLNCLVYIGFLLSGVNISLQSI